MPLELLTAAPLAGTLHERHYDLSPRDNTWVRFDDGRDRDGAWVGVFGNHGGSGFSAAVPFPDDDGRTVLVVARGEGYFVDSRSGILLRRPRWGDACSALAAPGRDGILVASPTMIWAAGRTRDDYAVPVERMAWATTDNPYDRHRVAVEGIIFHGVTHRALSGVVKEPEGWRRFELTLDDLRFARGEPVGAGVECLATESYGGCPPSAELAERMLRYRL
jgi:hypothetical protein